MTLADASLTVGDLITIIKDACRKEASMPPRRHLDATWRALSDICILSEYFCLGFGVALLTDPRLHWTHRMGSPALDRMVRSGQVWWGIYALAIVALSLWQPRWFGLVAAISLAAVRGYDFWHDDAGHNWYFLAGQLVFVALAMRGTYWRRVGDATDRP